MNINKALSTAADQTVRQHLINMLIHGAEPEEVPNTSAGIRQMLYSSMVYSQEQQHNLLQTCRMLLRELDARGWRYAEPGVVPETNLRPVADRIHRSKLIKALELAILTRVAQDAKQGFNGTSDLVLSWRSALTAVKAGAFTLPIDD